MELTSFYYQKKITLYYIGEDSYLNSYIINSNYDSEISIAKVGDQYSAITV